MPNLAFTPRKARNKLGLQVVGTVIMRYKAVVTLRETKASIAITWTSYDGPISSHCINYHSRA